jgi:hypothetical protein
MAATEPEQPHAPRAALAIAGLFTLVLAWAAVAALLGPAATGLRHPAVRETALAAFLGWALGAPLALARRPERAAGSSTPGARPVRAAHRGAFPRRARVVARGAWEHTRATGGWATGST